jgi:hypothetical protein
VFTPFLARPPFGFPGNVERIGDAMLLGGQDSGPHEPSIGHILPSLGCFFGTLNPACRQIRSTRLGWDEHWIVLYGRVILKRSCNSCT